MQIKGRIKKVISDKVVEIMGEKSIFCKVIFSIEGAPSENFIVVTDNDLATILLTANKLGDLLDRPAEMDLHFRVVDRPEHPDKCDFVCFANTLRFLAPSKANTTHLHNN